MDKVNFKFKLGSRVRDIVSGFTGVVVGRADYITGCHQYCLRPKAENSHTYADAHWFDDARVELVKGQPIVLPKVEEDEPKGADIAPPTK